MPDKVLLGHVNQDTAFYVEDYPFGFRLRCKIRYWIETAEKGAKKGEMRMVSQTTNPKKGHPEFWNKPNPGIYCPLLVLVQREDNNHIECRGLSYYDGPDKFVEFRKLMAEGMPSDFVLNAMSIASRINELEFVSRKCNRESWLKYDQEKAKVSGYKSDALV